MINEMLIELKDLRNELKRANPGVKDHFNIEIEEQ